MHPDCTVNEIPTKSLIDDPFFGKHRNTENVRDTKDFTLLKSPKKIQRNAKRAK